MEGRDGIGGAQLTPGADDVVALLAVALDLDPPVLVSVLDHHDQAGPALGEVVSSHALAAFVALA